MNGFKKYFKDLKKEIVLSPLFKLLEALLELLLPLIVARIIDVGIKNNDISFIIIHILIMVLFGLVGFIFSGLGQYFSAKAAVKISTKVRSDLFSKIQELSFEDIDNIGTSKLITRMTNDVNQVQNGINLTLRLFLRSPFVVFGSLVMSIIVYKWAGILFGIVILVLSIIVFGIMMISKPLHKKVQESTDKLVLKNMENLTGSRVIRSLGIEENEKHEFSDLASTLQKNQNKAGNVTSFLNPLTFVVVNLAILVILYLGKPLVLDGVITTGMVVALINYMSQILVELVKLANLIVTISKALASKDRIMEVLNLDTLELIDKVKEDKKAFINFDHVSFKYKGQSDDTLKDISFTVNEGETIGIIGGTGSGKSTLASLIARFYDATEGTIYYNYQNINSYSNKELNKDIAIVLQKAILFKGTIYENIKWGNDALTKEEAINYLKLAAGSDILESKENGIDEIVEQNGRNYSGGQKQRISIARALAKRSKVLILDDSSSALDYKTDSLLRKNINSLNPKPTLFIISQRTSSIKNADKILVLDDGKIVGEGTHSELLKSCPLYYEIHHLKPQEEEASR